MSDPVVLFILSVTAVLLLCIIDYDRSIVSISFAVIVISVIVAVFYIGPQPAKPRSPSKALSQSNTLSHKGEAHVTAK
jgi:hypothetical protein